MTADLDEFRATVRSWCEQHIPRNWRESQTGVGDDEFVRFQKSWFAELHSAGYAVPHWPREWGGGMSVPEQIVLYQELAAHDAPRLVLAFVGIHHAASTLRGQSLCPAPCTTCGALGGDKPSNRARPNRGGSMTSNSPASTSVGTEICERRSAVSCPRQASTWA